MNSLNKSPRYISYEILLSFINKRSKLQQIINFHLTKHKLSDKDKSFITEICYGVIRNYYFIENLINKKSKQKHINKRLKILIMIGVYQLKFLKGVPSYAAINTSVHLSKILFPYAKGFINAILRNIDRDKINDSDIPINIQKSCPNWLYQLYINDFGSEETLNLINEQVKRPSHWIRINDDINKIMNIFSENNIDFTQYNYNTKYLSVNSLSHKIISELLSNGIIYIQSPSSGHVVDLLNPKEGDSIIDGCSSPGGKLTDMYFRCKKLKKLHSYEINYERYKLLKKNINIMSIDNISIFNKSFLECSNNNFNKILIDVPCSGTGSINKKPDIKILRKLEQYNYFNEVQTSLLNHSAKILKRGYIVYSTCSLNNLENWNIIDNFLHNNKNYKVSDISNLVPKNYIDKKGALFITPHEHKLDGIFAVRLTKLNA